MKRRDFLWTTGMGLSASLFPRLSRGVPGDLDRFGGLNSVRFEGSGFFRVEKKERWWLVTPDGAGFLSYGLNHGNPEYLLKAYNIDFWRSEFGFKDPSDPVFREKFVEKVLSDIKYFGMNTLGCHAPKHLFGKLTVPYIQGLYFVKIPYWIEPTPRHFWDVWSPKFAEECEKIAENVIKPRSEDPFLIGYTFTNVPILTDLDADAHEQAPWGRAQPNMPSWPRSLRNHGGDAPGKKVYVDLIRERYPDIAGFNKAYGTDFASFDALRAAQNWSPFVKQAHIDDGEDNRAFFLKIYDQYLTVACATIRKFDSNHLLFGDPLNANTGVPDDVVALSARHTDFISYQYYGRYGEQQGFLDRWSRLTGKAIFNTDSCFVTPYDEMPTPVGALCPDQKTRSEHFLEFASQAFARPEFIGWNWCGWMDSWHPWKPVQQHPGLQDPFGRYHHPMPEVMRAFGKSLYEYGLSGV